jgi:hypothetical protein
MRERESNAENGCGVERSLARDGADAVGSEELA